MRVLTAAFAVVAMGLAARAEASQPVCLAWGYVVDDGGTSSGTYPLIVGGETTETTDPVEPADSGVEIPPPPRMRKVCTHRGYRDEGGCSVAGGLPAVVMALAALAIA